MLLSLTALVGFTLGITVKLSLLSIYISRIDTGTLARSSVDIREENIVTSEKNIQIKYLAIYNAW